MINESVIRKIEGNYMPVTESGCWIWLGTRDNNGYAQMIVDKKKYPIHRIYYESKNGPIAQGLVMDHLCKVRACINPNHFEIVSDKINILRGNSFAAINSQKTHCKYGHPFTDENTYRSKETGHRRCKECDRKRDYSKRVRGNGRKEIHITFEDSTKCISQWARQMGLKRETIAKRLRLGWTPEKALTTPAIAHSRKLPAAPQAQDTEVKK